MMLNEIRDLVRPHPGPLPQERGNTADGFGKFGRGGCSCCVGKAAEGCRTPRRWREDDGGEIRMLNEIRDLVRPHPGPLPQERGNTADGFCKFGRGGCSCCVGKAAADCRTPRRWRDGGSGGCSMGCGVVAHCCGSPTRAPGERRDGLRSV